MKTLTLTELKTSTGAFDASAEATPGISTFCSCSDWVLSAHEHLHGKRSFKVFHSDGHWVALVEARVPHGRSVWLPLEAAWGFACPLLGPDPSRSVALLARVLDRALPAGTPVVLSGVPAEGPFPSLLAGISSASMEVCASAGADCALADLGNGFDAYFAARSANFRRTVRRACRDSENAGIRFEYVATPADTDGVLRRVIEVDQRTERHRNGTSIFQSASHCRFYAALADRASSRGRFRALFARIGEMDVAYYIGAGMGGTFRGFQMGYDERFAECGLGNATHIEMVRRLAGEGIKTYDLGMVMDYKHRWSDRRLELLNVLLRPVR